MQMRPVHESKQNLCDSVVDYLDILDHRHMPSDCTQGLERWSVMADTTIPAGSPITPVRWPTKKKSKRR